MLDFHTNGSRGEKNVTADWPALFSIGDSSKLCQKTVGTIGVPSKGFIRWNSLEEPVYVHLKGWYVLTCVLGLSGSLLFTPILTTFLTHSLTSPLWYHC